MISVDVIGWLLDSVYCWVFVCCLLLAMRFGCCGCGLVFCGWGGCLVDLCGFDLFGAYGGYILVICSVGCMFLVG